MHVSLYFSPAASYYSNQQNLESNEPVTYSRASSKHSAFIQDLSLASSLSSYKPPASD